MSETTTLADQSWKKRIFVYDGNQVALQFDSSGMSGTPTNLTAANLSHRYLWGPACGELSRAAVDQLLADERTTVRGALPESRRGIQPAFCAGTS